MHVTAHLDIDALAHETNEQVSVLLELTAPTPPADAARLPQAVQVVLDRSGSMNGAPLDAALAGLRALIARLEPTDWFGLVVFDNVVDVVVPSGPLTDKASALRSLERVAARGGTDLSAGLLRGLQEACRAVGSCASARLLLVSDGHANAGVVDPSQLGQVAAAAAAHGVTSATIGVGLGYDEVILDAVARGGNGDHVFAESADEAAAALPAQVEGLLAQSVQAASLLIRMDSHVAGVTVHNDFPSAELPAGVQVELGSLYAGESRRVLLTLDVPSLPALGLAEVASLDLTYVSLPDLVTHSVSLPIAVNVVPGDVAAGRAADPVVTSELAYLVAQKSRRVAAEALRRGDRRRASAAYDEAASALTAAAASAPAAMAPLMSAEAFDLAREAELAKHDDLSRSAKRSMGAFSSKTRQRGRQ